MASVAVFKNLSKAVVRIAAFEPSSVAAREFVRLAQAKKVREECPDFKLEVFVVDPPRLNSLEDHKQSRISVTFTNQRTADWGADNTAKDIMTALSKTAEQMEIDELLKGVTVPWKD